MPNLPGGDSVLVAERRVSADNAKRTEKLDRYLARVRDERLVTAATAELAWAAWEQLLEDLDVDLAVPDACPGPDGQVLFSWEREPHYLELELFPDRPGEFLYRNDDTGALWECDWRVGESLPVEAAATSAVFESGSWRPEPPEVLDGDPADYRSDNCPADPLRGGARIRRPR